MERLGYKKGGNPNIRGHKFFDRLDWTRLEQRKIQPPFKPAVVSGLSTKFLFSSFSALKVFSLFLTRWALLDERKVLRLAAPIFKGVKCEWNETFDFVFCLLHLCNKQLIYLLLYNTQVILAFWLVLAYDLLEDRRTDDDSARFKLFWIFWILNLNQSQFFAMHSNQSVRFIFYGHKITSVLFSFLSKWRNLK